MKAKEITFGVELEGNFIANNKNIEKYQPIGYHTHKQINEAPEGWITKTDASLNCGSNHFNAEIVSPILKGEQGLVDLVYMVDMMIADGWKVNNSCGLHVHVGTPKWGQLRYKILKKLYIAYERAFYAVNGEMASYRRNNHYCKCSSNWNNERYNGLNFSNTDSFDNAHVEFRIFAGSNEPRQILGAVIMSVALVAKVSRIKIENLREINSNFSDSEFDNISDTELIQKFINEVMNDNTIIPDYIPDDINSHILTMTENSNLD